MKKFLASLVCCALLFPSPLTQPVNAASPQFPDRTFRNEELIEMGTSLKLNGYSVYHRNQVAPVFTDPQCKYALDLAVAPDGSRTYVYYDRQGNIYNIDEILKEHYYYVFPFYEGLAAVIKLDNSAPTEPIDLRFRLGYVNTAGEEVIPCKYQVIPDCYSQGYYASRFKNGCAYVLQSEDGYKSSDNPVSASIAKIDKQGNIVSEWTHNDNIMNTDIALNRKNEPVFQELQLTDFTTDYTTEYTRVKNTDLELTLNIPVNCDAVVMPVTMPNSEPKSGVVIPADELGLNASQSRYRSTAKLTRCTIADMNYNDFELTITNPTDGYDSGTVALVLASDIGTVHFVDYTLAPEESKSYSVTVSGHMGDMYAYKLSLPSSSWSNSLNADIITFSSDEDLASYRAAIPYEQNSSWLITQGSSSGQNAHVVICNSTPGDEWLKSYTGIQRCSKPNLDTTLSHNICKP